MSQFKNTKDTNIFLIGFMGAGKSLISKTLQNLCGMETVEMDQIIEEREGMKISEIFRVHGEPYFRDLETKLLMEIGTKKNVVVSCGGGTPLREVNVQEMKKSGRIVFLIAKPETIYHRVKDNHDRPLLENNKNVEFIRNLLEQRYPKYEAAADVVIHTDGKDAARICAEILEKI